MMPDPEGPEGPATTGPSDPAEGSDNERAQPGSDPANANAGAPVPATDATIDPDNEPEVDPDEEDGVAAEGVAAEGDDSDGDVPPPGPDATAALLTALAEGFGLLEQAQDTIDGADGSAIETDPEGRAILRAIAPTGDDSAADADDQPPAVTPEEVAPIMEALLFVSATPLTPDRLRDLMGLPSIIPIRRAADHLRSEYDNRGRSFELVERANGYILQTRGEFESFVTKLRRARMEQRMTHAALVTLSIVAYKQPITRSEIDSIRGAGSQHHLRNLVERGLVRVVGRKHAPGYPSLYGTTSAFLRQFGLRSLRDLPQEAEFGETDVEAIRAASRDDLHDGDDMASESDEGLPTIGEPDDGQGENLDQPVAADVDATVDAEDDPDRTDADDDRDS